MKFIKLTNGNVVISAVTPKSAWIDQKANRSFVGEGHIEVDETISDGELLEKKYDSTAEEQDIKTLDSFTGAGVDNTGVARWFDWETGNLMQYTYDSETGAITGQEQVT
tara:strand:- start:601 stop:927 length:327 start_codon:yes stop_codon:yes gene_type:complete